MNAQIELSAKKSGLLSSIGYRRVDIRQYPPFFLGPIPLYNGMTAKKFFGWAQAGFDYEAKGMPPKDIIQNSKIVLVQSFMLKWTIEGIGNSTFKKEK